MDGEQTTRLTLDVGERRTIALRALATAGYRWLGSVGGAEPAAVALEVRRGEASPDAPPGVVGVAGTVGGSVAGGACAGRSCVVRLRIGGGLGRGAAARLRGRLVFRWRTVEAGFLVVVEEAPRAVSVGIAAGAWSVETV